jgi:hypothetical protein
MYGNSYHSLPKPKSEPLARGCTSYTDDRFFHFPTNDRDQPATSRSTTSPLGRSEIPQIPHQAQHWLRQFNFACVSVGSANRVKSNSAFPDNDENLKLSNALVGGPLSSSDFSIGLGIDDPTDELCGLPNGPALRKRIEYLKQSYQDEEGVRINDTSIHSFISFWKDGHHLKPPELIVSTSGNLMAQWRIDERHLFLVHFLNTESVRYVAFLPNSTEPAKLARLSGTVPLSAILNTAKTLGALGWLTSK